MSWQVAPLIVRLRQEVDAKYPNRDKSSDGTIGDADHSKRWSDHNPWVPPPDGGYVTAVDIDASGGVAQSVADWVEENRPPWLKYQILNRQIMSGDDGPQPWVWRPYNGSNPHTSHIHISVENDNAHYLYNDPLGYYTGEVETPKMHVASGQYEEYVKDADLGARVLKHWSAGDDVAFIQRWLGLNDDGYFGPVTKTAVERYQKIRGLTVDGIVGPKTWGQMGYGPEREPEPPKFPLPFGHWFGPESPDSRNHSGYWKNDRAPIRMIDKQLGDSVPEGRYTDALAAKVKKFQRQQNITADGLVGPETWKHLF